MKKKFLWLFLCCVMVVTLVAWSCGGTQNGEQEEEEEEEEEEEDGISWADIPVYPGADRQYEEFSIFPSVGYEEDVLEWRYYRTSDSSSDVSTYYRDEMPEYGWNETAFRHMPTCTYNKYTKTIRQEMAYVLVASYNGDTIMALIKGHEK